MRWAVLALVALLLSACGQADNLNRQVAGSGGTGYDVRLSDKANGQPVYEASAAYNGTHNAERQQITTNVLYRGLTQVKADGYDFVLMEGPFNGLLTSKTMRAGVVISSKQYPAIQYKLTGYKKGAEHPPKAVDIDKMLVFLKPQVSAS
jgi:hypothetical protein